MSDSTTIYLLRHGDRFDYSIGKDAWVARCRTSASLAPSDPPLSAGGHAQAREVAAHLASVGRIDMIIVSPYLRTLQTAQPLAHATGLPLCVDFAVAESHQRPAALPPLDTRLPYFPEIDTSYSPLMASVAVDGTGVEPRIEHLRRLLFLSQALQRPPFRGKTVVVVTHAASVALIAALRGSDLLGAGQLAACGVAKLVVGAHGRADVVERGDDASSYLRGPAGLTGAWGFANSAQPLETSERLWREAQRLGPADPAAVPPHTPAVGWRSNSGDAVEYEPESEVAAGE
uniref:Phosphoglycerate mutase n=1 Tax=Emiliania huxleyi TaxID=2903 RepID=A0A6U8MAN6_EMIHU|mmetsp:Transcript_31258/g.102360  ORF Transcript_31258/g.102360 Transcript_31258/m.102360 type:complete len:288 (+) Transcript_31258:99-962(+)